MTTQALKAAVNGEPIPSDKRKPKEQIAYWLEKKKGEIRKFAPKHLNAERLLKVAQIAATTTPALLKCDIASLIGAIGQCAQMGLEPNTVLGHAYLVPFNNRRKDESGRERWVHSVQLIIGYKGLIDLARRSGQIVSITAHEVCENDEFECVYGLNEILAHKPSMEDRGEVIAFYAVAKLKDGGHAFEVMSRRQIEAIRDSSKGNKNIWNTHFIEMGRKSVIRRLAKYLPLSIEFQTAVALDNLAEAGKDQHLEAIDGDFMHLSEEAPPAAMEDKTVDNPIELPADPDFDELDRDLSFSSDEAFAAAMEADATERKGSDKPVSTARRTSSSKAPLTNATEI